MQFRIKNFLISFVLIIGALLCATPSVYAASGMETSEECINMIKEFEGFKRMPYFDYSQWSVGYGTACEENAYPNGIAMDEADQLLRTYLDTLEKSVNKFLKNNGVELTQNQFDALMSFTYNVGSSWMYDNKQIITKAILDGAQGNDFLFAITRWCIVSEGGVRKIAPALVNRRLIEANMYLNGEYVNSVPSNYRYMIFEDNIEECITDTRIQGYDNTVTDVIRAVPSKAGCVFLGWYTAAEGGQWITHVGPDTKYDKLYAHWQTEENGTTGVAANYIRYGNDNKIYGYPAFTSTVVGTLGENESAAIVADYIDSKGVKWGKIAAGKWVCLSETLAKPAAVNQEPIEVRTIRDQVNVRTGPGTGYDKSGTLSEGDVLLLTEVQQNGNYKWGKCDSGWVCLDYTDYDLVIAGASGGITGDYTEGSSGSKTEDNVVARGTVGKCTSLRIRAGAGTNYDTVGSLKTGDQVEILEIATVNGLRWGKITEGWICLSYVQLESGNSTTAVTGKVINCSRLNVRAAPGVSNAKIDSVVSGTVVTVYEQAVADGETWGRIDQGWVHMDYIYLGNSSVSSGSSGYTTGVVYNTDTLRIRKAAGVQNAQVGSLSRGTVVIITETTKVGATTWGKIDKGWISLDYVQLDGSTVPVGAVSKTVNTKSLRIRAGAGTNYECIGSYVSGDQVVIVDQTIVKGRAWGRTDKGWICMEYVT